VGTGDNVGLLSCDLLLVLLDWELALVVETHLGKLLLNVVGVGGLTSDSGKRFGGVIESALFDVPSRRFGEEGDTTAEDECPEELNSDGDSVRSRVRSVLGGVADTRGEKQSDGDGELVSRDNGTSDLSWGDLTHVEDDDGGDEADTETRDETTGDQKTELAVEGGLEDTSDGEDNAARDNSDSSTKVVGQVTGDDGTEEGTGGEDRGDQGDFGGGNDKQISSGSVARGGDRKAGNDGLEVWEGISTCFSEKPCSENTPTHSPYRDNHSCIQSRICHMVSRRRLVLVTRAL
jgi:hypothetical protein